jgi:hypothetical protein
MFALMPPWSWGEMSFCAAILAVLAFLLIRLAKPIHGVWPSVIAVAIGASFGLCLGMARVLWPWIEDGRTIADLPHDPLWNGGRVFRGNFVIFTALAGMLASWLSLRCFGRRRAVSKDSPN